MKNTGNDNFEVMAAVVSLLKKLGTQEIVVCAGSRNAPLALYLAQQKEFKLHSYFEERSAGFFALGRSQNIEAPVAVLTTSGTAAANLLPSVIEAHYSETPLIALTADRPKRFRGTGAPQSIEQAGLFKTYCEESWDWDHAPESLNVEVSLRAPLHLNFCLDDPLVIPAEKLVEGKNLKVKVAGPTAVSARASEMAKKINRLQKPLVIVGRLPIEDSMMVRDFLLKLRAPVYLEAHSQLREDPKLQSIRIKSSERILNFEHWDGVVKIGGTPHLRFWRDLENADKKLDVISIGRGPFSGNSRAQHFETPLEIFGEHDFSPITHDFTKFFELDKWFLEQKQELFLKYPYSEPAMIQKISRFIEAEATVFLGNSLPIREWDLCADSKDKARSIWANRGANGIDGQLATFFGLCGRGNPNWALLGDLSLLYDLPSLQLKDGLAEDVTFNICVINNKGGRIFSRLPQYSESRLVADRKRFLETEHRLEFSPLAQMFSLAFEKWDGRNPISSPGPRSLIEIQPDLADTESFWRDFDDIWRTQ